MSTSEQLKLASLGETTTHGDVNMDDRAGGTLEKIPSDQYFYLTYLRQDSYFNLFKWDSYHELEHGIIFNPKT